MPQKQRISQRCRPCKSTSSCIVANYLTPPLIGGPAAIGSVGTAEHDDFPRAWKYWAGCCMAVAAPYEVGAAVWYVACGEAMALAAPEQ